MRLTTATVADRDRLAALRQAALEGLSGQAGDISQLAQSARKGLRDVLPRLVRDGCLLAGWRDGDIVAMAGVDLDGAELFGPFVAPRWQGQGFGRRLLVAAERRAAAFQLFLLDTQSFLPSIGFFEACGYAPTGAADAPDPRSGLPRRTLRRHFPGRQTRYGRTVVRLGRELGIPHDYGRRHRLPLQPEAARLADAGPDLYSRPQRLAPRALSAWTGMRDAATADGVELQLVSAYRSVDYQAGLLRRKLEKGQSLAQILAVSAAPGFSEHHTGRALDLTTPGSAVLEEEFEATEAFAWLKRHAAGHGFRLSFPRNNRHRVLYEPWHWYYQGLVTG